MSTKSKEEKDRREELKPFELHIDNWRITADSFQYILQRGYECKKGSKAGQMVYSTEGYYPKLEQVLVSLLEKRLKDADVKNVEQLLTEIRKAEKNIVKFAKGIKEIRC